MKRIPILYSAPMVLAFFAGRKTQTRRKLKVQPDEFDTYDGIALLYLDGKEYHIGEKPFKCPYGEPGDVLWGRESTIKNLANGKHWPVADGYKRSVSEATGKPFKHEKSVPSIHMPYDACRIFQLVTETRVEQLQSISTEDAIAEGIECRNGHYKDYLSGEFDIDETCTITGRGFHDVPAAVWSYMTLWESINGPGSWEANPYVWAVSFTPTTKPV